MAPKHHPTPLSGGDHKALHKELGRARAMTSILAAQSAEMRAKAESLLQQADRLLCESWNERMWSDGEPPRDPLELRKSMPGLLSMPQNKKSPPVPTRTKEDVQVDAAGSGVPSAQHSTAENDPTANTTCSPDFDPFPDAVGGRLPRGPDYGALGDVIAGLVDQSRRFRFQWRVRHNSDPSKDLATPLIVARADTVERYVSRGFALRDQYIRTMASSALVEDVDPIAFVDWVLALRPLVHESAWRFYRAGAERFIQTLPHAHMEEALGWLYSDLHIGDDGKTSEKRANRLDQAHFEKLKLKLGMKHGKTARWLEAWLDAGITTGVHPAQWPLCALEILHDAQAPRGKRIWLHVVAGRVENRWLAHRSMDISTFEDSTVGAIEQMIKNAREWACKGQFAARQGEVNQMLRKTSKQLFHRWLWQIEHAADLENAAMSIQRAKHTKLSDIQFVDAHAACRGHASITLSLGA